MKVSRRKESLEEMEKLKQIVCLIEVLLKKLKRCYVNNSAKNMMSDFVYPSVNMLFVT